MPSPLFKRHLLRWTVLAALVGIGAWIRLTYFTDQARITRTLRGLLQDVSFTADAGNLTKAAKFNSVIGRFTDDITIRIEQVVPRAHPLSGRTELQAAVQGYFTHLRHSTLTLHDVVISALDPEARTARAALTASAVTSQAGVEFTAQEFELELKKDPEGRWLISQVAAVRTLKP